jgi:hypothetical protein
MHIPKLYHHSTRSYDNNYHSKHTQPDKTKFKKKSTHTCQDLDLQLANQKTFHFQQLHILYSPDIYSQDLDLQIANQKTFHVSNFSTNPLT